MPVSTTALCEAINAASELVCIPMVGGAEICFHPVTGHIPDSGDVCKDIIGQLNVAMAALAPILCLIDVALALVNVAKAIPDSLGPPPDPSSLIEAITDLLKKVACLLPLIPQLSICPMIKGLLTVFIQCLRDIRDQLTNLIALNVEVSNGRARSSALGGVALLDSYLDCAEDNVGLIEASLSGGTVGLQRLIDITINPLLQLAGLDPISFSSFDFTSGPPEEFLEPIDVAIEAMEIVQAALPCP